HGFRRGRPGPRRRHDLERAGRVEVVPALLEDAGGSDRGRNPRVIVSAKVTWHVRILMWDGFSTRRPPAGRLLRSRGRVENPSHMHFTVWARPPSGALPRAAAPTPDGPLIAYGRAARCFEGGGVQAESGQR